AAGALLSGSRRRRCGRRRAGARNRGARQRRRGSRRACALRRKPGRGGEGVAMTRKKKRLSVIGGGLAFLAAATGLTFYALGQKSSYFYMPADLAAATIAPGERIRLGGLVEKGSILRGQGTEVSFAVTDQASSVKVVYAGILPDLFREEQGVV